MCYLTIRMDSEDKSWTNEATKSTAQENAFGTSHSSCEKEESWLMHQRRECKISLMEYKLGA